MRWSRIVKLLALSIAGYGCGDLTDSAVGTNNAVVVGISADAPLESDIARVNVTVQAGSATHEHSWSCDDGSLVFPLELGVPPTAPGTRIVAAVRADSQDGQLLLMRRAETTPANGRTLLLPVRLNDECVASSEHDISCPNKTCSAGLCVNPFIHAERLDDYAANWHQPGGDRCQGDPGVILGAGELPFKALEADQVLTAEAGTQGLAHVFLSVRMSGLLRQDTVTVLTGQVADSGVEIYPLSFAEPYQATEAGCEVGDLMFVLPGIWDTTMELGATVIDPSGDAEHHHIDVYVEGPAAKPGS